MTTEGMCINLECGLIGLSDQNGNIVHECREDILRKQNVENDVYETHKIAGQDTNKRPDEPNIQTEPSGENQDKCSDQMHKDAVQYLPQNIDQPEMPNDDESETSSSVPFSYSLKIDTNASFSDSILNKIDDSWTGTLSSPTPSIESSCSVTMSPPRSDDTVSSASGKCSDTKKKTRRRGTAWTDDETYFLMEIWARQAETVRLSGGAEEAVVCAPVYRMISKAMVERNYQKSWEQCKTRIHTLKRAYKITRDEMHSGLQTITYCRHFDKLEIINGDNSEITPGMLADTLEKKRKDKEAAGKTCRVPVKRKLVVGENPINKKQNIATHVRPLPGFGTLRQGLLAPSNIKVPDRFRLMSSTSPSNNQTLIPTNLSCPYAAAVHPLQQFPINIPPTPPYPCETACVDNETIPSVETTPEVNNRVIVKTEKPDTAFQVIASQNVYSHTLPSASVYPITTQQLSSFTPQTAQQTTQQSKTDLERMRLDLEIRKLEVERNKIEMEERQRREERDHQYRMMQLLLFGLGQQNISQFLTGQGSEITHAQSTDLSRALENGLVPGGTQTANEKGLSFNDL